MARRKGSKRARYAIGGYGIPNIRFTPEQLDTIKKGAKSSKGSSTSRADAVASKAAAKPSPSMPRGIAAGSMSTAAIANAQAAKNKSILVT